MVKVACSLAAALLLVSSGAAYSRSQASPTTLVWANGTISDFAQDGNQIAWASVVDKKGACKNQVWIRLLGPKKQKLLTKRTGPTCSMHPAFDSVREYGTALVLAGKQALWTITTRGEFKSDHDYLVTSSYGGHGDVLIDDLVYFYPDGDRLRGIAGDSSTLVYGVERIVGDENPTYGGGVERVTGVSKVAVPGAPPPAMLAAAGNRVAIVVAETGWLDPGSPAHAVVIDAVTGASVGSFSPEGMPLAIAFSPSAVAVLESTASGRQIEFRTPAGALLRTVEVEAKATGLSTTNTRTVFRVGKSIRTVGVRMGSVRQIATAKAIPIGLSIEGKRVAWAENVKKHGVLHGRIRAITIR
jgi:hypothetical protein